MTARALPIVDLPVQLERDVFLRSMLRELAGTLQDVVGLDDASGFISVVGQQIGDQINDMYRDAAGQTTFDRTQVAEILIDLKRRIQGDFSLESSSDTLVVLTNTQCPFGDKVLGRPALCMMTSNVFGSIAAENLGYARVVLNETIAEGHGRCRVSLHLTHDGGDQHDGGREYFAR